MEESLKPTPVPRGESPLGNCSNKLYQMKGGLSSEEITAQTCSRRHKADRTLHSRCWFGMVYDCRFENDLKFYKEICKKVLTTVSEYAILIAGGEVNARAVEHHSKEKNDRKMYEPERTCTNIECQLFCSKRRTQWENGQGADQM